MQDRAILALGQLSKQKLNYEHPYQYFVQDMFPGKDYKMLLAVIDLEEQKSVMTASFSAPEIEIANNKTFQRYLYRNGSSRGGDITPTTKAGDIQKKLSNSLITQIKSAHLLAQKLSLGQETAILGATLNTLSSQFDEILKNLVTVFETIDNKTQQSTGFSLKFRRKDKSLYLCDFETFQTQIHLAGVEGKKDKYKVTSATENQVCSICMEKKPEIVGFASPFKFATVDKPGMVAGFFRQKNNWKNYPICTDCSLDFELGKTYLNQHLKKSFFGESYFMIPKPVLRHNHGELQNVLKQIEQIEYQASTKEGTMISRREDRIMKKLGECENSFSMTFLFFDEHPTTKAMNINLMLEDILPSRFRKLFIDVPKQLQGHLLYKDLIKVKKERYDLAFSFGLIKEFFPDQFQEMIRKIFRGEKLSLENMWSHFMLAIRKKYLEGSSAYSLVIKSHLLLNYFAQLGLIDIHPQPESNPMITQSQEAENKPAYSKKFDRAQLEAFIQKESAFFDQEYKKGVFAVGILVRLLFNIQARTLNGNTPFEKKLKGFHLNHESLTQIYVEALYKLSQITYRDTNFFTSVYLDLREYISEHFTLNSHQLTRISNNELSFYFVAGFEMGNQFKVDIDNIEPQDSLD